MKKSNKINAVAAAALATATLVAASAFADSRPTQETWRARSSITYRNHERVTVQGRVHGVVDRVDDRYGTLLLRDARSRTLIMREGRFPRGAR